MTTLFHAIHNRRVGRFVLSVTVDVLQFFTSSSPYRSSVDMFCCRTIDITSVGWGWTTTPPDALAGLAPCQRLLFLALAALRLSLPAPPPRPASRRLPIALLLLRRLLLLLLRPCSLC